MEPSHIRQAEATAIYHFLLKRQKKKAIVLEFKYAMTKDIRVKWGKKKRKASQKKQEWVDPDDDNSAIDNRETKRRKTSKGKGKAKEDLIDDDHTGGNEGVNHL
jgi:hypothetical protein